MFRTLGSLWWVEGVGLKVVSCRFQGTEFGVLFGGLRASLVFQFVPDMAGSR